MLRRWAKVHTASISPVRTISPSPPFLKPRRRTAILALYSSWVGADFSGTVLGARVTEHHETPGLGDKIELRLSDWITHFSGKTIGAENDAHWAVKKDGGDFDQFTGATITPRAVVNAVKRAGLYAQTLPAQLPQLTACGE
ncbi:electron transport complex protein RnfG [Citrobacter koseri]|uniref:Electron transport complex protein RnfG n=1 Tax=Citrobacter koseri TaxID=545 RepID=A0A2X2WGU1_CITKO|nr:electron transport complex protein RnfG [Citrobacter koseri]